MSGKFQGFPKEMFQFLNELRDNNNREWFTENKPRYQNDVVTPICHFIEEIAPHLAKISKHYIADPRANGGSMFRIYRDVRFSKNKRPYKDHAACQFRHSAGRDAHCPGFYLHLEPGNVKFGGGIWMPPSDKLRAIRTAISTRPSDWQAVLDDKALKRTFNGIHGDGLTRPPKGFDGDHPMIEDIKRKTFFVMADATDEEMQSPNVIARVAKTYKAAAPLMAFICDAVGEEF